MNPQLAFNVVVAAGIWGWVAGLAFEVRGAVLLHRGSHGAFVEKKGIHVIQALLEEPLYL